MKSYKFTESAAARIADAVRRVERTAEPAVAVGAGEHSPLPQLLCRFELLADAGPGETVAACARRFFAGVEQSVDAQTMQVRLGQAMRGRARDTYSSPNDKGSCGLAWKPHDHADWEVVWLEPLARRCTATAKGAIAAGAAGTVDNVLPIDGGLVVVENAAAELAVTNVTAIAADDNGDMEIEWDETNDVWRAYPLECPA